MSSQCRISGTLIALTMWSGSLLMGDNSLSITNYQEVSEQRVSRTQSYFTYSATLVNTGGALSGATATLTSLSPSVQVVAGQGTLHFGPVASGGQVPSIDTFTILVDTTVTFSFSSLQWSFGNPVANAGPNQTVSLGATVTLNGSASSNPSGTGTLTYSWSFVSKPAGSVAVLANANTVMPTFVVDAAGSYVISLTVSNGTGSDSATVMVSTGNSPPVADAGPNQSVAVGATVVLQGNGSHDVDGDPLTYVWTLLSQPRGSTAFLSNFRSVSPTFVADQAGTYVVQLVVNDGHTDSLPATVMISSGNTPPVANAGPNQVVPVGTLVQLDGSQSTDVNGNPLTYRWSLIGVPAGSAAQLSNPSAVTPTFTADLVGTFVAQLIVNDGFIDSTPATVTITANTSVQAPTANAGANQSVGLGMLVTLNGSGTDPQGLPLTLSWSLLSRPAGSIATLSATNIAHPTFVLDFAGSYVAQLIVSNGTLSSAPSTVTITTANTPPVANAGAAQNVTVGTLVTLDGSGSYDVDHDPLAYSWSFLSLPAGSSATLQGVHSVAPTFTADVAGTFVVQLIVNDGTVNGPPATVMINSGVTTDIILPAGLTVAPGDTAPFPITLARPAVSDVLMSLTSSNPGIAAISSSSVIISAGQTQPPRQPNLTGVANGSTTITAQATGLATASTQVNVGVSVTLAPANLTIGGTTGDGTLILSFSGPTASNTTFTLKSDNAGIATVPPVVFVPTGTPSIGFKVTPVAQGTTKITASAPGFTDVSATVMVLPSGTLTIAIANTSLQLGQTTVLTATITPPAPLNGTSVTIASSDASVSIATPSLLIPQGGTTATTQITAVTPGAPSINASAPGYNSPAPIAMNIGGGVTISWTTPQLTLSGNGQLVLQINATVPGGNYALLNGLTFTLTSSDHTVATVPGFVTFVWDGSAVPTVHVPVTMVGPGTTSILASAMNIAAAIATVTITGPPPPSGPLAIATTSLPDGAVGSPYTGTIVVQGGALPYSIFAAGLPDGLFLNSATGQITGTPTVPGSTTLNVTVTDGSNPSQRARANIPLTIDEQVSLPALARGGAGGTIRARVPDSWGPVWRARAGADLLPHTSAGSVPSPVSVSPASGSGLNQTFTFTFSDPAGFSSLGVVDILINNFLDGRNACYVAFVGSGASTGSVYLVDNAGDAGGPYAGIALPSSGSASNNQCSINGTGSSVSASGTTLTLTLNMSFTSGFAGNKVVYMAAADTGTNNSGWQTLGTWNVPGPPPTGPSVVSVTPGHSTLAGQAYTFTFSDTNGFADLSVLNVLINNFIDGRHACYVAYVPSAATTGTLFLVDDAGDAGGPFQGMAIPSSSSVQNSQCIITGAGSSASASGNTLTLTLAISFNPSFAGNRVIYPAARSNTLSSDWQALGTVMVPTASSIAVASGSPQSATINTAFANPLVVTVTDTGGLPVQGLTVFFAAPGSGASAALSSATAVTNASGQASVTSTANGTIGGPYTVAATVTGLAGAANFSLTNTNPATSVTVSSGNNQSTLVSTAFGAPLVAIVKNVTNQPVQGVTVQFAAPGSGASAALSSPTAVTNASGLASVTATANATAGPYTVSATVTGVAGAANFSLTNNPPAPGSIAIAGGNSQSATTSTAFGAALVVIVKNTTNAPQPGVTVTFTAPASGASANLSSSTAVTNASGLATITATANGTPGPYVVSASVTGLMATASFSLTNTPPGAATLTVSSAIIGQNLQDVVTITLNPPAPVGGVTLTIESSDPNLALVGAGAGQQVISAPISAGSNLVSTTVQALAGSGSATITVVAAGYTTGISTITFAPSGFVVAGPSGIGASFTTYQGVTTPLSVYSGRLDSSGFFAAQQQVRTGSSTVNVPVASSMTSIGTVSSASLAFSGGTDTAGVNFNGISMGVTSVSLTTPSGFSTPTVGAILNVNVQQSGLIPFSTTVGQNLEKDVTISLLGNAQSDLNVTLTSNDSSKLKFSTTPNNANPGDGTGSITVKILSGHATSPTFYVQGFATSGGVGYSASASGFGTVSGTVTLAPAGLQIQSPGGPGAPSFSAPISYGDANISVHTGRADSGGNFVEEQLVAPTATVSVTVASSNTAIGTITSSPISISSATSSALTTLHPLMQGSTTVTASAAQFASAQVTANFTPPPSILVNGGLTIGKFLEQFDTITLSAIAGAGGVPVTVQSSSGQLLLGVSPTDAGSNSIIVTVPAGQRSVNFYVQALTDTGAATYTASSPGLTSSPAISAQFAPSGIVIFPSSINASIAAGSARVSVIPAQLDASHNPVTAQPLAGGQPALTVAVSSNNTTNATVPASVVLQPGLDPASVNLFTLNNLTISPLHTGSATILVTQPSGFTTPISLTSTAVTVNP